MPNKYEREIEEILRNLEHTTEPKPGLGQKFGERFRKRPDPAPRVRHQPHIAWQFSLSERLLLVCVCAALLAGGYAYLRGQDIFSLLLAAISIVCFVLVACSQFLFRPRRTQVIRYKNGNRIELTPVRRTPLSMLKTQWNLLKLKMRYRRKNSH